MKRPKRKRSARHALDRIIIGNQIAIMRALEPIVSKAHATDLHIRGHDLRVWWRHEFDEEVGFSSTLGDSAPGEGT